MWQCCGNSLSRIFGKNFVKVMVLLHKSQKSWFDEIFLSFFHTVTELLSQKKFVKTFSDRVGFWEYVGFTKFFPKENESNISVTSALWIPHCELRFAAMYKMWKKFREINVLLKPLVSRNFCEKSREFKLQTVSKINSYLFEDRRQTLSFDSARLTCLQHCHHWYEL